MVTRAYHRRFTTAKNQFPFFCCNLNFVFHTRMWVKVVETIARWRRQFRAERKNKNTLHDLLRSKFKILRLKPTNAYETRHFSISFLRSFLSSKKWPPVSTYFCGDFFVILLFLHGPFYPTKWQDNKHKTGNGSFLPPPFRKKIKWNDEGFVRSAVCVCVVDGRRRRRLLSTGVHHFISVPLVLLLSDYFPPTKKEKNGRN